MTSRLEIEIVPRDSDDYAVRVIGSDVGETGSVTSTIDTVAIASRQAELEKAVTISELGREDGGLEGRYEAGLREVGRDLFESVFSEPIRECYRANLVSAQSRGEPFGLGLTITSPELAALPWEAMYDSGQGRYVCQTEPMVRRVPVQSYITPLRVEGPLRVLGIVASPVDLDQLDVDAERELLDRALSGPVTEGRLELRWCEEGTWAQVQEALLGGTWHVVHFIGHGGYDHSAGEGVLALKGPDRKADLVGADRFAILLTEAPSSPRLVVLNSCSSAKGTKRDLFSSTAATLVRQGVSAVTAMQFPISDSAALAFSRGLYQALAVGRGIDEAVKSGRTAILGRSASTLEWVTPVLYLRGGDTRLFDVQHSDPAPATDPAPHMEKGDTTVGFNIGSMNAEKITQISGNQYNNYGTPSQDATASASDVRRAATELANVFGSAEVDLDRAPDLMVDAARINREVSQPDPDKRVVAELVQRILAGLQSTAGSSSVINRASAELRPMIDWLGPEWQHLLRQLP